MMKDDSDLKVDLSVVILCYKEGRRIERFVEEVIRHINEVTPAWEIVLVGNYHGGDESPILDETPHVVRELAKRNPRIKAVALEKKGMMGWDARSGFAVASGETIALIDGDGQMAASDLCSVYRTMMDKDLDMVKTYRVERHDGLFRNWNSKIYNLFFRTLFPGFPVRDVNSKPKLFRRAFFDKLDLRADDWFIDAEIIIQARRLGCRMEEVPTVFLKSQGRKSFVRAGHISEFVRNMIEARFREFFVK